jgi:hypothetical protein
LLPIFCYIVVRAAPVGIFSELRYMDVFVSNDHFSGQEGYALATLSAAVDTVSSKPYAAN